MSGFGLRRDEGGSVPTESLSTQNPLAQQRLGNYGGMDEEQLQETALRLKGTPQGQLAQRALQQKRLSPQQSAAPADPSTPPAQYAFGGSLQPKGGVHISQRAGGFGATPASPGGFLHTAGPGRTDNLSIKPHADSYVLPADVVSGMGEGNSLAGAKAIQMELQSGPHGIPLGKSVGHRMGPPKAPAAPHMAAGGSAQKVPIVAAGGELVITPEECQAIGHKYCKPGDPKCSYRHDVDLGHDILDKLVLHARKANIKDLRKLKGPVR